MSTDVTSCGESQTTEQSDISVIGIGCRFPGATCLSEFWDVLRKGENHISDFPSDRWSAGDFYDPDPDPGPGKSYTKKAGFINNFADFDHKLFGISGTEAAQMDPQQRQVLECTYMALEDAGITRQQIGGQNVGVYLGSMNSDFSMRIFDDLEMIDQYSVAGIATSVIANRISYVFNLTGPSMSIDTACSSSLVAIHQAILGLRAGDCSLAICGGVNLMLHPQVFTPLCKAQMLSKTGQCHAFSDAADGYTRGEGCGIVLLKRTDKAIADGNSIWGNIVTGLNQDGHFAQPITAPSQKQQETLLKSVFTANSVDPAKVQYIEAHGTGTKRGDPVEVNAFSSFFSEFQQQKRYIGSVKTNIGHLEPAAGVAGLIKVLLMMKHNTIVPSLHFDKPNELLDFDSIQLTVPTKCIPWTDDVKVACLNSFGFGGANSHAIIKSYSNDKKISETSAAAYVICFSGSTLKSLHTSMADFLSKCDGLDIQSVSYTSTVCREHFKFRKAFVTNTTENLKGQVQNFLEDPEREEIPLSRGKDVIFVFCGMGTAWKGMCKHFMQISNDFKESIELIEKSLNRFVPWSLTQRLETSYNIHDPLFGPIAIFSCQVALARLWKTWGVTADTVVGQSIGEVAAAHIAGILPLDEAVKIIYHRTNILSVATGGKMLMVRNLNTTTVAEMCKKYKVNIALYYSPISCTVSGDADLIEALKEELTSSFGGHSDVQLIDLNVTSAFHSHHMNSCQQNLDASLADLKTKTAEIGMVSSVNPEYSSSDLMSLSYWGENVRQPVRFHDAIKRATKCESTIFIEIGPKPVLKAHLKDIFGKNRQPASLSSMFENSTEENFLTSVAFLYEHNMQLEWNLFNKQYFSTTPVPRYSFDHRTFWKLGTLTEDALGERGKHLFLKQSDTSMLCKITIKPSGFQSVYEHKVDGIIVIPGATYAEAGFGLTQLLGLGNPHTSTISVKFFSPVTLKMGQATDLDVHITVSSPHALDYTITRGDTVHAEGTVITTCKLQIEDRLDLQIIKDRCPQYVSGEDVYQMLNLSGFSYGEDFATIDHAFKGEGESLATLKMSGRLQQEMHHTLFHPAVLDGMLQVSAVTFFQNGEFLPIELMDVTLQRRLIPEMIVYTKVSKVVWPQVCFFLCLFAPDGTLLAQVRKFITKNVVQGNFDEKTATFKKIWMVKDLGNPVEMDKRKVVVVTDSVMTESDLPCQLITLDKIKMDAMESFRTTLNEAQSIFFLFESPQKPVDGNRLLEELISRITPLRLMILYHVKKDMQIPFTIIMENRKLSDICGIEAATSCLNEATNAFCRCVLREYKSLQLKTVELFASDRNEFSSRIPRAMDHMLSTTMTSVSEVKLHDDDEAHVFALQANVNPAPVYRTTAVNDTAVLCSKSQNAILEPAFFPAKSTTHRTKSDETEFFVSTVVLHSRSLHWITLPLQANFGSSEEQTYPILSMEFLGNTRPTEGPSEMVALYPSQIMKTINVPRTCILDKDFFPDYQPGYLIMLYTLWCMCTITDKESVAILYDPDTKPLAEVLHVLLKSKNIKPILVSVLDVSKNVHKKTLITTVLLTTDITRLLAENWKELRRIICHETITNTRSVGLLTSCHCFSVNILRHFEMFSLPTMLTNVPKLLHWIKSHAKNMEHLVSLLKGCVRSQLMDGVRPIKLTEILPTSELSLVEKVNSSLNMVMKTPSEQLIKASKSYIVVGGQTGLGWECVSYLAVKGAGNVIILSRSQPTEEKQVEMTQLGKKYGCTVVSVQADVSAFKALEECFSKLKSEFLQKPLAGIFFGAAVLCDATVMEMTKEKLKSSLAPKVSGAWNLHLLTADLPLDFFVFHSSVTSVFGNAGQSNYGAGNGFMDELAHCRRRHGLSGQSVNWGPLGLGMLNNNPSVTKNLRHQGYDLIEKRDIGQCLTHLLMINEPQTIMIRMDRRKMAEHLLKNKETSMLTRLKNVLEPFMKNVHGINNAGSKQSINIDHLRTCSYEEMLKTLQTYLKQLTCEKALLDEDTFDMKIALKSQGVDSMYAMEISGDIMSDIGVKLSVQEIQLQTGTTLSEYLAEKLTRKDTTEMTEEDMEIIVSKHQIISSVVQLFFGFNTNHEFRMASVLVCTVQIPDFADPNSVKELLKKCISLHSPARSTCTFNEETFSLRELSVDDAFDFRCLSGTDLSEVSRVKKEPINLETHGPLRFIFLTVTHDLIIIFHKFFFDMRAITIFVSEISNVLKGTSSTQQDTEKSVKTDNFTEIQKVLAPQFPNLLEFWKTRIRSISYNSFRDQFSKLQHQRRENILITKTLDSDCYKKALDFVRENRLTFFEYFVSIYQLYLTFVNDSFTSVVTTSVDTRSQVPKLVQSLGRCTNLVPLICQLADYSETVTEFLNRNKVDIQKFLENGIFPFGEMRNLAADDHVEDLTRNYFIFEDDVMTNSHNKLKIEHAVELASNIETVIFIWQKREANIIEIELYLNGHLFEESRGRAILDAFVNLFSDTMSHPEATVTCLKTSHIMAKERDLQRRKGETKCSVCSSLCCVM